MLCSSQSKTWLLISPWKKVLSYPWALENHKIKSYLQQQGGRRGGKWGDWCSFHHSMRSGDCLSFKVLWVFFLSVCVRVCHRSVGSCRKVGFPGAGVVSHVTQVHATKPEPAGRAVKLWTTGPSGHLFRHLFPFVTALCFRTRVSCVTTRSHMRLGNSWLVAGAGSINTRQNSNCTCDLPTTLVCKVGTSLSQSVGFVWLIPSAWHGVTVGDRGENILTLMSPYILICNGWPLKSTSPVCRMVFSNKCESEWWCCFKSKAMQTYY